MNVRKLTVLIGLLLLSAILPTTAQTEEPDLKKGLVAYWSFDEGEGDIAFDKSGNNNDGGLMCAGEDCSPPKWVKGKIGYALEFDGKDDYVEVADDNLDEVSGDCTILMWVKINELKHFDVWYTRYSKNKGGIQLNTWKDKYLEAYVRDSNGNIVRPQYREITQDVKEWHLFALLWDQESHTAYIFKDGSLVASDGNASVNHITISETHAELGKGAFRGIIDEVRIYDRGLSKAEIESMYE